MLKFETPVTIFPLVQKTCIWLTFNNIFLLKWHLAIRSFWRSHTPNISAALSNFSSYVEAYMHFSRKIERNLGISVKLIENFEHCLNMLYITIFKTRIFQFRILTLRGRTFSVYTFRFHSTDNWFSIFAPTMCILFDSGTFQFWLYWTKVLTSYMYVKVWVLILKYYRLLLDLSVKILHRQRLVQL